MTHRVPVEDGHTLAVSVRRARAAPDEIARAWEDFRIPEDLRGLPSAPSAPILYSRAPHRPQPRRDVDSGGQHGHGRGSLPCTLLDWKFTALGHNTARRRRRIDPERGVRRRQGTLD
jgi:aspartate-semialdehyde dehydrogenase